MKGLITYAELNGYILFLVTELDGKTLRDIIYFEYSVENIRYFKKNFKRQYGNQIVKRSTMALKTLTTQLLQEA